MKLRNKKTGKIVDLLGTERAADLIIIDVDFHDGNPKAFDYTSLAELNKDWEDCKPTEPLIKDPRIRKAVKAWADANGVEKARYRDDNYQFIAVDTDSGSMIEFETMREKLKHEHIYTITELCGEEEE